MPLMTPGGAIESRAVLCRSSAALASSADCDGATKFDLAVRDCMLIEFDLAVRDCMLIEFDLAVRDCMLIGN